ncbi:MAG: CDP-alcohol phosphatidyltransferase family protein [Candidatus Omnitrophica bacterium]|nr:CDP-alcohol phosphatidyltransferase family protein [Candidatus Omnitrophota bacterium]
MRNIIRYIPVFLTGTRFPIAVILLLDAKNGHVSKFFLPLLMVAAFTDVLDGFVARKLNVATELGALLDGYADIALYVTCLVSAFWVYPVILHHYMVWIVGVLILQLISWGFSLVKFRKMTSYHTYTAKVWGVTIGLSVVFLFGFGSGALLPLMILAGFICNIEEIFITSIMPYWKAGILSYKVAEDLRRNIKNE